MNYDDRQAELRQSFDILMKLDAHPLDQHSVNSLPASHAFYFIARGDEILFADTTDNLMGSIYNLVHGPGTDHPLLTMIKVKESRDASVVRQELMARGSLTYHLMTPNQEARVMAGYYIAMLKPKYIR